MGAEQVAAALMFTSISKAQEYNPAALVAALRRILPPTFSWSEVVLFFDQPSARISATQFLKLYQAMLPAAQDSNNDFDIQRLWGGSWNEPEAQLSFVCAYTALTPDQLDATTIPNLHRSIKLEDYANSTVAIQERAAEMIRHPLVSTVAMSSIFNVALNSPHASQGIEAKRLFQEIVVPNLDIFLVSAFEIPRQSWVGMADDTINTIFETFLYKRHPQYDFVMDSLWRKDKDWVTQRLGDAHAKIPIDLPLIFDHVVRHNWLDELVYLPSGFGIDLAALAHAENYLDISKWAQMNMDRSHEVATILFQFLAIKCRLETQYQRTPEGPGRIKSSTTLQVKTVSAFLQILEDFLPKTPMTELIVLQRSCITAYPRLINYGEGVDDVIDANGKEGNVLPPAANAKMEEHFKKMYSGELEVRNVVDALENYKQSRDPLDQDVFACMIHGLFDEFSHYVDYPMEALATTAVLFGGIISHKLVSDVPLKIGLGMILEAVRDHGPRDSMFKFGLQALMQMLGRLREWPGFCKQLLQIPALEGTEPFRRAEEGLRDHEEELARGRNGDNTPHGLGFVGEPYTNGTPDESAGLDRQAPPFASIYVEPISADANYADPGEEEQDKIQFALNNITESNIQSMTQELRDVVEARHQQWFASHLVEARVKLQPNNHGVYLDIINLFQDASLWGEVLRETYISVARMLNSEATMQNSSDRVNLKNLGGWLGLLTLARDKPIKHRNIAFKQLLMEAHDTKRLIVVIPFVCKVLLQGASSAVFRPPNPWLMEIIHLLIDLYHHAELKLNLKFEIEVLCKGLSLDHRNIEPTGDILNRPPMGEVAEVLPQEQLDAFENLSLNGLGPAVASGLQSQAVAPTIPDLSPLINIPPHNEMVTSSNRLHEIVLSALTRALQDIIQPVVDRSVTIAAISTIQMIRKDFGTEPDEDRLRTSAISMVKATAGSLALVTSKEPLRANFTNYIRTLANDIPSGLPEGTIIMCVNNNIDLACSIIERQAEERAIPEIEALIQTDLDNRRRHRATRPEEPYYDPNVSRWSMTIPHPYKLSPNANGLNPEQMAIYEDFGRQPRSTSASAPAHAPSTSDATRSLANEVLQEQFSSIPNIPTPAETPSVQQLGGQMQPYPPVHAGASNNMANGRGPNYHMEMRALVERVSKLLQELIRVAGEAREEHFATLPRPHTVLDLVDALVQSIIKAQASEDFVTYAVEQIISYIFQQGDDSLTLESLVHVLEAVRKISKGAVDERVHQLFDQQPGHTFLNLPLLNALIRTDLLKWNIIDQALSRALEQRKDGSLEFLDQVIDLALMNNRPIILFADFVRTLEAAWAWMDAEPGLAIAKQLESKLMTSPSTQPSNGEDQSAANLHQMEYIFEEWVSLCNNYNASSRATELFIKQLQSRNVIRDRDDFFLFVRVALDLSVDYFERILHTGSVADGYQYIDALATLISMFISLQPESSSARPATLDATLSLISLVAYHHQVKRGEHMCQRVFFRLLSMLLHQFLTISEEFGDVERRELLLRFAGRFAGFGPLRLPTFIYGWLALLQHRVFLPAILSLPNREGWPLYAKLLSQLLDCVGEQLKAVNVPPIGKDLYRTTWKLLVVVQHDFPQFMSAYSAQFCASLPTHCTQLINTITAANPQSADEEPASSIGIEQATETLRSSGLLDMLDRAVQNGPSEDVVAQIAHAMLQGTSRDTGFGYSPLMVNVRLIAAVTVYLGHELDARSPRYDGYMSLNGGEAEIATLSLLIHEVPPVVRYHLLSSLVNQLQAPNQRTDCFSHILLSIFGKDMDDPEETELRSDITRVLLERLGGYWPHPWGLMSTVLELLKNEKYNFFDLPFIKSDPEVS